MGIGTFGSFTTARMGVYAAQKGLDVTGNNIANINTTGYTRQKLDQVSLHTGGSDRFMSAYDARVGMGALVTGVSQLRDPYLDIRYRTTMADVGYMEGKLQGLNDIASIIDEVARGEDENGILQSQLSELRATLNMLTDQTGHNEYDIQVRSAAEKIAKQFNSYASQLEEMYDNMNTGFHQDLETVNKLLSDIRDLNDTIRKNDIHGDPSLELRDERNNLVDQLSKYIDIDVTYEQEDLGAGLYIQKQVIKLAGANHDPNSGTTDHSTLVNGRYATQISLTNPNEMQLPPEQRSYLLTLSELKSAFGVTYVDIQKTGPTTAIRTPSTPVNLWDNDLKGSLQARREMLTEKGEFSDPQTVPPLPSIEAVDPNATGKRGIQYYQKSLDLLANQLATALNTANNQDMVDENGNSLNQKAAKGGNLFSNNGNGNSSTNITAANISVSKDWASGAVQVVSSYVIPNGMSAPASTDSSNILHMVHLMDKKMDYKPSQVGASSQTTMFTGSFQEMLTNMGSVLGNDQRSTGILLDTYEATALDLDTSRDSFSGVDLNDEAMNLMQYQKAYTAACRLLTTLDEALDKLVNGTGLVGR